MVLLKTKRSQETLIHPLDFLYPHSATSQVSHDALFLPRSTSITNPFSAGVP